MVKRLEKQKKCNEHGFYLFLLRFTNLESKQIIGFQVKTYKSPELADFDDCQAAAQ